MNNNSWKDLKHLNHMLDLNYDDILDNELIDNAIDSMKALADNIHSTYYIYKEEGNYIDEDAYELLNKTYQRLLNMCLMLDRNQNI